MHNVRFDGKKLKALRESRSWDQHRLAETARTLGTGITQSQISRYENGQQPGGHNAMAIAKALGVPVDELYDSEADEESRAVGDLAQRDLLLALHAALGAALGASRVSERASSEAAA